MAFRFPGSDQEAYRQYHSDGRDLATPTELARWGQAAFTHPRKNHPGTTQTFAAASLGDVSDVDAEFFCFSPRGAAHIAHRQRILLKLAREQRWRTPAFGRTLRTAALGGSFEAKDVPATRLPH